VGLLTPPVGQGLFTVLPIAKVTFLELLRELVPFLIVDLIMLALITLLPELSLFLPRLFGLT
jgi:TRAP-type C4-dicarboxylate transport system permease large subunit